MSKQEKFNLVSTLKLFAMLIASPFCIVIDFIATAIGLVLRAIIEGFLSGYYTNPHYDLFESDKPAKKSKGLKVEHRMSDLECTHCEANIDRKGNTSES